MSNLLIYYSLDTPHRQCVNTPEDNFQDQWTLIQLMKYTQVNNQQKKAWTKNSKDILYQEKQSIEEKILNIQPELSSRPSTNLWGK